ncbi:MAG TPA: IS21 family transposase [Erysipelotrichaceae bacterium]|nr:IS21 family transposase [Erysipelotrichaceae bacterium]
MLDLEEIKEIRFMRFRMHASIAEICRKFRRDYRTVRKYLEMDDFNPSVPLSKPVRPSVLEPWIPLIDSWLLSDAGMPYKQRHTARRVYNRLKDLDPDFNCSYSTVNNYVRKKKKELNLKKQKAMIPLIHDPGTAQADFGDVLFEENGKLISGHELVMTFPYSNAAFAILTYGENTECLLEGLDIIFRFINGVPSAIWFDNASTMVSEVIKGGGRKMTERFIRFCEHYRIHPVFMNRSAGNEKGSVEAHVGNIRRNFFVPLPQFNDLNEYNQETLNKCVSRLEEELHYIHQIRIIELFQKDREFLLPLPSKHFDLSALISCTTGETGLFKIGRYTYSASPEHERETVLVKLTSSSVTVLERDLRTQIAVHRRLYGNEEMISIEWGPYLRTMSKKPKSFLNSGFRELLPDEMKIYLFQMSDEDRAEALGIMADLYESHGFEAVRKLCLRAAAERKYDPHDLALSAQRMFGISCRNYQNEEKDSDIRKFDLLLRKAMNSTGKDND